VNENELRNCLNVLSVTCNELYKTKDDRYAFDDASAIGDIAIAITNFWSMGHLADEFEWV